MALEIIDAKAANDIAAVKQLFQEYADWLPVDLGFQGFEQEMATFPDKYLLLLLARQNGQAVGAVGLIPHGANSCEMKRLFVTPKTQSKGTGLALCEQLICRAKDMGYQSMVLDSLTRLEAAVSLYRKLGFTETLPYNENPEPDVTYMRLTL